MTPPTIRTRRAWRRYFEALARSERALRHAERALGAVGIAASRFPDDPDAVAMRRAAVLAGRALRLARLHVTAPDAITREGTP